MLGAASFFDRRSFAFVDSPLPMAKTTHGPIRGHVDNGITFFKGIPYGLDTAQTRFAAPKPPTQWSTPLDCFEWAPRAPQTVGARPETPVERAAAAARPGYHLPADEGPQSEDCLHLNIWTPKVRDGKKRPVMFYIHGGAFANGTVNAQLYDGTRLARRGDVVVVTVNHRLNSFGYVYLAELLPGQGFEDSGNAGQLDLVLALQWVRDNIAEFGGDPARVMIFGQSGGGAKCATLMAQPPARGLFSRVLTMSGQQVVGVQPEHANDRARVFLKGLGIDPTQPAAAAKALRSASMEDIQKATRAAGYFGDCSSLSSAAACSRARFAARSSTASSGSPARPLLRRVSSPPTTAPITRTMMMMAFNTGAIPSLGSSLPGRRSQPAVRRAQTRCRA